MFKTSCFGKDHGNAIFITSIDYFLITDRPECVYVLALPSTPQTKKHECDALFRPLFEILIQAPITTAYDHYNHHHHPSKKFY